MKPEHILIGAAVVGGIVLLTRGKIGEAVGTSAGTAVGGAIGGAAVGLTTEVYKSLPIVGTNLSGTIIKTEQGIIDTLFVNNTRSPVNWAIRGAGWIKRLGNDDKWLS
jgi:hypothetical protein